MDAFRGWIWTAWRRCRLSQGKWSADWRPRRAAVSLLGDQRHQRAFRLKRAPCNSPQRRRLRAKAPGPRLPVDGAAGDFGETRAAQAGFSPRAGQPRAGSDRWASAARCLSTERWWSAKSCNWLGRGGRAGCRRGQPGRCTRSRQGAHRGPQLYGAFAGIRGRRVGPAFVVMLKKHLLFGVLMDSF